jgi:hypothetical protein
LFRDWAVGPHTMRERDTEKNRVRERMRKREGGME